MICGLCDVSFLIFLMLFLQKTRYGLILDCINVQRLWKEMCAQFLPTAWQPKCPQKDSKIWIIYIVPLANGSYKKNCLINIKNT